MEDCLFLPQESMSPKQPEYYVNDMQERDNITSWSLHPELVSSKGRLITQVIYSCFLLRPRLKKIVSQCEDHGTRPKAKSPKSE